MHFLKRHPFISVFLFIIAFFLYNALTILVYSYKDETQKADVAIVLGAAAWHNKPSPVFQERINHSIKLYEDGLVKKIIFTGGKPDNALYSESFVAKKYAEKRGVKQEDILIEEQSKTTLQNLQYAKQLMKGHHFTTALLVSDPLHMKRSSQMAKGLKIKAYSSPTPTSKYQTLRAKTTFLLRETAFYLTYLLKTIVTYIK